MAKEIRANRPGKAISLFLNVSTVDNLQVVGIQKLWQKLTGVALSHRFVQLKIPHCTMQLSPGSQKRAIINCKELNHITQVRSKQFSEISESR